MFCMYFTIMFKIKSVYINNLPVVIYYPNTYDTRFYKITNQ